MTLDRPERGHSRINVFGSADAPRKNGSDRMKRKTMAIFAVAAFVILSAVLIQAVDTDARAGDSEDEPKYIIGEKDGNVESGKELGNGLEAKISFNRTAFTANATVAFEVKGNGDYQSITVGGDAVSTGFGTNIEIKADDAAAGVYTVKFSPQGATTPVTTGTTYIKLTVVESKDQMTLSQKFYYAAHIVNPGLNFVISSNDSTQGDPNFYEYRGTGPTATEMSLKFDQYVSKSMWIEDDSGRAPATVSGYVFYGVNLPDGLSVTIDGRLGGKLSSEVNGNANGTMEIHAVKDGVDRELLIPWTVGERDADFELTVGDVEKEFVMVKVGENIAGIKAVEKTGMGTITSYKVTTQQVTTQDKGDDGWTVPGYSGTGTFVVTVTAKMTLDWGETTVVKTLTVYVVGGIYDGNLKPVVKTA